MPFHVLRRILAALLNPKVIGVELRLFDGGGNAQEIIRHAREQRGIFVAGTIDQRGLATEGRTRERYNNQQKNRNTGIHKILSATTCCIVCIPGGNSSSEMRKRSTRL